MVRKKMSYLNRLKGWFSDMPFPGTWNAPDMNDESAWRGTSSWGEGEMPSLSSATAQLAANKSWVYICNAYNARAIARQKLRLYKGKAASVLQAKQVKAVTKERLDYLKMNTGIGHWLIKANDDVEEITEHPALKLLKQVNPMLNQLDLWMLTETNMGWTGNAYWWLRKNEFGEPYQIWVWSGDRVRIILGNDLDNYIKAYVYLSGSGDVQFDPKEILHHKYPNPLSPAIGLSPIMALSDSVQINEEIYRYERAQFRNMARPDGVLEMPETLTDEEFTRLRESWNQAYRGSDKSGKVAILEGGVEYKAISISPREMNHLEGRKMTREEIADGYGIPMSLLSPEKSNRANATVAYAQYMRDTIDPKLKLYEEKINEKLLPLFGQGEEMFVAFDNCVPEDRDFILKENLTSIKAGYRTWNEVRQMAGKKPYEGFGDMPVIPANMVEFGTAPPPPAAAVAAPGKSLEELTEEEEGKVIVIDALASSIAKRMIG